MQIVIDIDEKVYKAILDGWWPDKAISVKLLLERGIPLPKGHGRIIDENKITKCEQVGLIINGGNITRCLVTDAPTIIAAAAK